jgi:hypothetical protein
MNAPPAKPPAAPPNFVKNLLTGFDQVSKHAWLVLFPIAVDLWLWLGPHLPMKTLLQGMRQQLSEFSGQGNTQGAAWIDATQQMWQVMAERFNLMIALRAYPVGIPSLMAGRMPLEAPTGMPPVWDVQSLWWGVVIWLAISLVGLSAGALYYQMLVPVALGEPLNLRAALAAWPKRVLSVIGVAVALVMLYLAVTLPASCLLMVAALSGLGQCILFAYTGFLIWVLFPFFLAGHGIFVYGDKVVVSLARGTRIARLLVIPTSLMFLVIIFLSQTLDLLWNATPESSWLSLLGVVGHAFVTTGLLAGTFVYYKEADQWVQSL